MFVNFSMQRILLFILLTTSLFAKDIIAVLDLETIGLNPGEATILTQRLTTKLISIGKYEVVERTNMDKILKEQKFQKSGCTDSGCAVEIGQLLNTDYIVIGSVNKFGSTWTLDARLIDVALGKGIISAEFTAEGKIDILLTKGLPSIAKQLCDNESSNDDNSISIEEYKKLTGKTDNEIKQSSIEYSDSATPPPSESGTVATEPIQTKGKLIDSDIGLINNQNNMAEKDLSDKTWSISIGFGTNRNFDIIKLTKDFKLTDNLSFYPYLGLTMGGGIGFCYQTNYNETGFVSAISYGADTQGNGTGSFSIAQQWKKKNKNRFFSLGLVIWNFTGTVCSDDDECTLEENLTVPWLVLGYDWRF